MSLAWIYAAAETGSVQGRRQSLAAEYGVDWKNTRFDRYLRAIETAAKQSYPRSLTWEGNRDAQKLFWEAASQTQQLINSSTFWASQDEAVIARKLAEIVKGRDLSPIGVESDHPRNTLVELTSAALLYRHHFDIQLSADSEDVLATIEGTKPFAVECKRPATRKGLKGNLKDARGQLRGRCANGGKQGLAIIVADRVLEVTGAMPMVQTVDQLVTIVDRKLEQLARDITAMVQHQHLKLFPVTKLGAIVLVGTVFVGDLGMPFTLGRMTLFCTAQHHTQAGDLIGLVQGYLARPPRELRAGSGPRRPAEISAAPPLTGD